MLSLSKLLPVLAVAVATIACVTPAAAQTLEVKQENGSHCPSVTLTGTDVNGGCLTHATSEGTGELRKHVFGIESHVTSCASEFYFRVESDGSGYILEQVLSGAGCNRQACKDGLGEQQPWKASGLEGMPPGATEGTEYLTSTFCAEPIGGGQDELCEFDIPFQSYENQHRQEYGHAAEISSHGTAGFRCELISHWNTETGGSHDGQAEQEVTVRHIDDPPIDPEQEIVITHIDDQLEQELVFSHTE
jgi:hypothetical protein